VAVATFLLVRSALVDDAYITLAYARNLAFSGHWGLLSDVPSNTATAPGWVLVLAAAVAVLRHPVLALGALHVAIAVGLERSLSASARRSGLPGWVGPVGALLVGVNPLLLSSVGLETAFLLLLLSLLLLTARAGRPVLFGLVAGYVVLTRMDAGVVVAVVALAVPAVARRLPLAVLAALAVVVPWLAWSWWFLGSAVPDTLIIKTAAQRWSGWDVGNGWRWYVDLYGPSAVASFLPAAAGVLGVVVLLALRVRARRAGGPRTGPWAALGAGGLAHWGALSLIVVPPFHWYYGVVVGTGSVVAVAAAGALAERARHRSPAGRVRVLPASAAGLGVLACAVLVAGGAGADVRQGTPWALSAIQTNYATSAQYAVMGAALAGELRGARVQSPGEIGHLAYTCDCVVDLFADRSRMWPLVQERRAMSPGWLQAVIDANYERFPRGTPPVATVGRLQWLADADVPSGLPSWTAATDHILPPGRVVLFSDPG